MILFGESAVRFPVPASIDERRVLLDRLRAVPGARDVVLCEEVGMVVFADGADRSLVATALAAPVDPAVTAHPAEHRIRVVYDGEDLGAVADALHVDRGEVVRLHAGGDYRVAMLGFLPGFAYLRGLAPALLLPRRAPRPRVPAHAVAVAAHYTGIYPVASAGGWHLLGRAIDTPRFELGDRVRFVAVAGGAPPSAATEPLPTPTGPHLVITRVAGLAIFVDGGRGGEMHRGEPPGGPLVRSAYDRASRAVGNTSQCALEITGQIEVEARGGAVTIGMESGATRLAEGERVRVASAGARAVYLAIEGGFAAAPTLLSAGRGRPLRRGDAAGGIEGSGAPLEPLVGGNDGSARPRSSSDEHEPIRIVRGPDADDATLEAIASADFTVSSASDRTGTRLVGPAIAAPVATRPSTPMIEGAIELTPSGLVVLGPDHPTTGGYPVIGVIAGESRDAFFGRPLGARVRFSA